MTDTFCKIPHTLMAATHWVSLTTGENLTLSGQDKLLWGWMKDRYDFFTSNSKDWFDNQDDIASRTGCSPSTVKRFIQRLTMHGYLKTSARRIHGFVSSNSYTIVQDLVLAKPMEATPVEKEAPSALPLVPEEQTPDYAPIIFQPAVTLVQVPAPVRPQTVEHIAAFDVEEPQWTIRSSP